MKKSRFWKIYASVVAAALVLSGIALAVFYDYIRVYERSQPLHAVEEYAAALTETDLDALVCAAAANIDAPYESEDTVRSACLDALSELPRELSCEPDRSAAGGTFYRILRGGTPVVSVTLEADRNMRYGFTRWRVAEARFLPAELHAGKIERTVYAPTEAEVRVNGVLLSATDARETTITDSLANPFESAPGAAVFEYSITGLYAEPEISCTLGGIECAADGHGDAVFFLLPDTALLNCTFTVPSGAQITLNGVPLTDLYRTGQEIAYPAVGIEAVAAGIPTESVYAVPRFHSLPVVAGTFEGVPLAFTQSGTDFRAEYPPSLLYSCRITVPVGSEVTMRGVSCTPYRTGTAEAYPGLFDGDAGMPLLDVYELSGLYLPTADVAAVYMGETLPVSASEEGKCTHYAALYPSTDAPAAEERALAFARDYFTYVSSGYRNTDENLQAALTHVLSGSHLSAVLLRSKGSISFVTPVSSQEYRALSVRETRRIGENTVVCVIDFVIDQKIYYIQKQFFGSISLVCTEKSGTWCVSRMLLDAQQEDVK